MPSAPTLHRIRSCRRRFRSVHTLHRSGSCRSMFADDRKRSLVGRAIREPLLQFMAIALVLFVANQLIHGSVAQPAGERITISAGRVRQIAENYSLLAGRMPSRAELQSLVDDFADEEIAYREAMVMGLDADDTIVRRRMRRKLEFLADDATASEEPTDE